MKLFAIGILRTNRNGGTRRSSSVIFAILAAQRQHRLAVDDHVLLLDRRDIQPVDVHCLAGKRVQLGRSRCCLHNAFRHGNHGAKHQADTRSKPAPSLSFARCDARVLPWPCARQLCSPGNLARFGHDPGFCIIIVDVAFAVLRGEPVQDR